MLKSYDQSRAPHVLTQLSPSQRCYTDSTSSTFIVIPSIWRRISIILFHPKADIAQVNLADCACPGRLWNIGPISHLTHPSVTLTTIVMVPSHLPTTESGFSFAARTVAVSTHMDSVALVFARQARPCSAVPGSAAAAGSGARASRVAIACLPAECGGCPVPASRVVLGSACLGSCVCVCGVSRGLFPKTLLFTLMRVALGPLWSK